jgi:hypothetical protein
MILRPQDSVYYQSMQAMIKEVGIKQAQTPMVQFQIHRDSMVCHSSPSW